MNRTHSPTFPSLHLRHNSFSNLSVALPTSQLILKPFRCFTYVKAHFPTLLSLPLHTGSSLMSPGEPPMVIIRTAQYLTYSKILQTLIVTGKDRVGKFVTCYLQPYCNTSRNSPVANLNPPEIDVLTDSFNNKTPTPSFPKGCNPVLALLKFMVRVETYLSPTMECFVIHKVASNLVL